MLCSVVSQQGRTYARNAHQDQTRDEKKTGASNYYEETERVTSAVERVHVSVESIIVHTAHEESKCLAAKKTCDKSLTQLASHAAYLACHARGYRIAVCDFSTHRSSSFLYWLFECVTLASLLRPISALSY